jgi:hypothetical protein
VNRFSRQEGDEKISLVYLRLNTLSPADAYMDDLVNENVVVLAQCLEDRPGNRDVRLDALVADENMGALGAGHVCSPLTGRRSSCSISCTNMLYSIIIH